MFKCTFNKKMDVRDRISYEYHLNNSEHHSRLLPPTVSVFWATFAITNFFYQSLSESIMSLKTMFVKQNSMLSFISLKIQV